MILAEATPDAKAFLQFALIISFLLTMGSSLASVAAFWNARRVQRREITFSREYAGRDELLHLVKDVERLRDELGKEREERKEDRLLIMAAGEARHEKTLDRITRLDDILGSLRDRIPK